MKFSTGLGFGLGLGAGLGFFLGKFLDERNRQKVIEERKKLGMNQNDRDYLEEKLSELKENKK